MPFLDDFPDYAKYQDADYYYTKVPPGVVSALKGLITRIAKDSQCLDLQAICRDIASRVPCAPTQNWGWNWLVGDLDNLLDQLSEKKLHKFMDFIYEFVERHEGDSFLEDLNDIFEEYDFGYRLKLDTSGYGDLLYWEVYKEPEADDEAITTTQGEVKDICAQTQAHLKQAKDQLQKTDNLRANKDAMRDCLSAMEALINQLGCTRKISDSTKALRQNGRWGPDIIVKDGLSLWNRMHDLYPDVRHGYPTESAICREEALFWIERLMVFVNYMARRKRTISGE